MAISGIENLTKDSAYNIEIYSFSNGKYSDIQSTIKFPAFLTDYKDSYKSDWQAQTVYGKMDPVSTFKSTSRSISVSFDIPNDSIEAAQENLDKIDFLIRGLYPVYSNSGKLGTSVMNSPPMYRVKFANLISNSISSESLNTLRTGLLCYIPSFDFSPKVDSGFFVDGGQVLLPKLISASLTLNIIHEHQLGNYKTNGKLKPRININNFPHKIKKISADDATPTSETNSSVAQPPRTNTEDAQKSAAENTINGAVK